MGMKTAVSIPNDVFVQAEALAHKKGMSRSEFYATALAEYIRRQDLASLTEEVNRAIDEIGEDALKVDPVMKAYQAKRFAKEEW